MALGSNHIGVRAAARYRPYVLAVVATLVIVALPSEDDDRSAQSAAVAATAEGGPSVDATAAVDPATAAGGAGGVATGVVGRPGAAAGAGSATGAPSRAAAVPAGKFPGVGTPEALQHPQCDSGRGKFKIPSIWAPPCVVEWPKGADNSGATAPGVTADSIRIVWRLPADEATPGADEDGKAQVTKTFAMWEALSELWGRKIDLKFYKASGSDEVAQRADAIQVATLKPFLVLTSYDLTGGAPFTWSTELAARGIISFDTDGFFKDQQAQAGYRWAYAMDDGLHAQMVGEWVGKRLVGRPAQWAGDLTMRTRPRVFGMIHPDKWNKALFDRAAGPYGVTVADVITYPQGVDVAAGQERARVHISRLKDKGVTSLIAVTDTVYTLQLTREATNQQFSPEWVMTGWGLQDLKLTSQLYDQSQWRNAFGLGMVNLLAPPEKWEQNTMYRWYYGGAPEDTAYHGNAQLYARDLFPALQLAGPTLSPATFRAAMFAKPPAGGPWAGSTTTGTSYGRHIGVAWDDYSGYDGLNETWWDPNTLAPDEAVYAQSPGTYWRVNRGKQYTAGKFPTGEPQMFDNTKATYQVQDQAPEDEPPKYPPPKR